MARKKPPKNKPRGHLPTGVAKTQSSSPKSKAPASSAAKPFPESDPPLAGASAQLTQTSLPAQEDSRSTLAKQSKPMVPETLAVDSPSSTSNEADILTPATTEAAANPHATLSPSASDIWKGFVKETSDKLVPKETPFVLESGESCVTIPNAVVEKNKKAWECFILGQFYEEPPAKGAIHAIVNGIWSRQRRDITVNKMEENAFLFRVPCPNARRRILKQSLWQIDGQTMFVSKWSPGIQQIKPELETVPVWLEFTGVPLQFFNKDALKEIAGMVGNPIYLHPTTENLTNIEVAKVYTVIDPRKPLPEFVNARRIAVSSPWLPSLYTFCKKFGHTISKCKHAPKTCLTCNSVKHSTASCPRTNHSGPNKDSEKQKQDIERQKKKEGKRLIQSLLPIVGQPLVADSSPPKRARKPKRNAAPTPVSPERDPPDTSDSEQSTDSRGLSGSSVSVSHNLSKGSLCVDLSADGSFEEQPQSSPGTTSSSGSSSDASISEEDDNPQDGGDEFIEFFSKRYKKREKSKARARGPLIL